MLKETNLFIDSRINFYFRRENREYKEKTFAKDIYKFTYQYWNNVSFRKETADRKDCSTIAINIHMS